ncbi:MAG: hypothetical protein RSD95_11285 [Clostridia bacterium]
MSMFISSDVAVLRSLASRQLEIAHSKKNRALLDLWKRHGAFSGERPVIHVEVDTFEQEVITPLLVCEHSLARQLEHDLYHNMVCQTLFDDDTPVPDYFLSRTESYFHLFGYEIGRTQAQSADGSTLGHRFHYVIGDLHEDYDKLGETTYGVNEESARAYKTLAEDTFGDILPVRPAMDCLYAVPTQQLVHMMGMENMFIAMCDYEDEFLKVMGRIADDYINYFQFLCEKGYLLPTTSFEKLGNGSFCFTNELSPEKALLTTDVWGFMDSQETVGVSPAMFHDMIFPCYQKIAGRFGLMSYGCCENVAPFWNDIGTLQNIRKVSISPWCDEEFMAERLQDQKIIYHRKPSPNYLGVNKTLDEDALRGHIKKSLVVANKRHCKMEITQRDVYTIHGNLGKVKRFVAITREEIGNCWR